MTTICQKLRNLISSAPERATDLPSALAEHVATCLACQAEVHAARKLTGLLVAAHDDVEPALGAAERAIARFEAQNTEARAPLMQTLRWPMAVAAAVLIGVGVMMALPDGTPSDKTPEIASDETAPTGAEAPTGLTARACTQRGAENVSCAVGDRFVTAAGERLAIELSDGTRVELNHDTVLALDPDRRRGLVLERGEVLLDVVKQKGLPPLTIRVPAGEIRVIGTQLQVAASPSRTIVDVLRGVVEVISAGITKRLGVGDEALMRLDRAPRVYSAPNLAEATRWVEPIEEGGATDTLGFGSLKARRPGAKKDTEAALRLVDHKVTAKIQGRVARTVVEEAFHNDTDHVMEGIYSFPIPPGARIAALDLMVDGEWEHGAIVDRARGEKIWRGVIRNATRKKKRQALEYIWVPGPWRDPALLTWKKGSEFELRIFPIPKRGERRVRIAYTETLDAVPGGRRYVYPLSKDPTGQSRAELFAFDAVVGGVRDASSVRTAPYDLSPRVDGERLRMAMSRKDFTPEGDIVIDVPDREPGIELMTWSYRAPVGKGPKPAGHKTATAKPATDKAATEKAVAGKKAADETAAGEGYALLGLRPHLPTRASEGPLDLLFVIDTSYSTQSQRLKRAASVVGRAIREVGAGHRAHAMVCAVRCAELGPGFRPTGEALASELEAALGAVEPLGTTALDYTFEEAAKVIERAGAKGYAARVIYLGDGIATIGELDTGRVAKATADVMAGVRVTTVSLGGQVDQTMLEGVARATGGDFLEYGRFRTPRATALALLQRQWGEPLTDVALTLPEGLTQVAPAAQGVLWPGQERLIAARLDGPVSGEVILTGRLGGEAFSKKYRIDLVPQTLAGNAFLPRLWAERRIADLEAEDATAHRAQIVALSKRHHVISRHTSLLVLESPAMARAFKVEDTRPVTDWTGDEQAEAAIADYEPSKEGVVGKLGRVDGASMADVLSGGELATRAEMVMRSTSGVAMGSTSGVARSSTPKMSSGPSRAASMPRTSGMAIRRPQSSTRRGRRGGRYVAMKKVWYREASIGAYRDRHSAEHRELVRRETRLDARPESRDRTRELVSWYLRMGMVTLAEKRAQQWLEKDRMDAGALMALADVAALRGNMARSEALLASAVEVDHTNLAAQSRMVGLYLAAGELTLACAHSVARAILGPEDVKHVVAAARCAGDAERFLARLKRRKRRKADRALAKTPKARRVSDRIVVQASWEGETDLDIVVLDPRGRRVSWQGGAKRVAVSNAKSLTSERLALSADARGRYKILMVHADAGGDDEKAAPVKGRVTVRSYGTKRTLRFTTDGRSANAASLRVVSKWRHERVSPGDPLFNPPPPPSLPRRLSKRQIIAVFASNSARLKRCSTIDPTLTGRVQISVRISPNGRVRSSKLTKASWRRSAAGKCIERTVRSYRFPRFGGSRMTITVPLDL